MKVLVLCGGRSAERDVSCVSAAAIIRNLSARHKPSLVRVDPAGRWHWQKDPRAFSRHPKPFRYPFDKIPVRLEPGPRFALRAGGRTETADVVFPALHGPFGEDGTLQGCLDVLGVPYVGPGVLGSAVGMDKEVTKRLARAAGLPVLPYAVLESPAETSKARGLRIPLFVKPARLGSSVGVYKVKTRADLAKAVRKAFRFDTTVIVEQGVRAREIECAVLGGGGTVSASAVGEIRPNAEFYSYEAKYLDPRGAELLIPAELSSGRVKEVQDLSIRAFKVLGGHGLARVDFLMDWRTGKLWFNEVNTLPGFTAISMYPKLWEYSGVSFPRLIDRLLGLAVERHRRRSSLRVTRD